MAGNIYTRQKCMICGERLVHDEKRGGLFCETHPDFQATKEFYMKFGADINKRFRSYDKAYHYLIGLRWQTEQGTLDKRKHMHSNSLGFNNLAREYLEFKKEKKLKSYYHVKNYINRAVDYFGCQSNQQPG